MQCSFYHNICQTVLVKKVFLGTNGACAQERFKGQQNLQGGIGKKEEEDPQRKVWYSAEINFPQALAYSEV